MSKKPLIITVVLATLLITCSSASSEGQAMITLNPSISYQTILGWEATDFNGNTDLPEFGVYGFNPPVLQKYQDSLAQMAVNDLGINRVRLQINSGAENPTDYFSPYILGQTPRSTWGDNRYTIVNDNDDPHQIDFDRFHWEFLDYKVDTVVLPLKNYLEARGEQLYVNLNYVDFGISLFEHNQYPEEYAEFVLAVFLHLDNKYGWVPDGVEIILEPDCCEAAASGWNATRVGEALVATAERLEANGFYPRFTAPSNSNMGGAASYFDNLIKVAGAAQNIDELSYHRYSGVSDTNLQAIGDRALQYGVETAQLEWIGATYQELHKDLKIGLNSSWAQYTLAGIWPGDGGGSYYKIDLADLDNPVIYMASRTKLLRQYFKFVRSGAVRIEATSTSGGFDPLAFINTDGKYVVVVKADSGGDLSILGLPPGTYGIKYTTTSEYDADLSDQSIAAGQTLNADIPDSGVVTIYAKIVSGTSPSATPTDDNIPAPTSTPVPQFAYQTYLPLTIQGYPKLLNQTTSSTFLNENKQDCFAQH